MSVDWRPLAEVDPLPGDPQAVFEVATWHARVAGLVGTQASVVRRVGAAADWAGPAADAFRARVGDLPRDLDRVSSRLEHVAQALREFAPALESAQRRGRAALARAHEAQARAGVTPGSPMVAASVLMPGLQSATDRELSTEVAGAGRQLAAAIEARDAAAARCARSLHRAGDDRLRNPHGWRRALLTVSAVAGGISTWFGVAAVVLCFVPGLGQILGAVAISAAGLTLLSDLLLTGYGDRGWRTLALDGLGVLPAGRALRISALLPREVVQVRAVVRAAGHVRPAAEVRAGARDLARVRGRATAGRSWPDLVRSPGGLLDDIARARELRRGGAALVAGGLAADSVQVGVGRYAQVAPGGRQ